MFQRFVVAACLALLVLAFAGAPASAQTVKPGIDLWISQDGTMMDFSSRANALPSGFFGCAEKFRGTIRLQGEPLKGEPSLHGADTIIARLDAVDLKQGSGSTRIQIQALSLKSDGWVDPCGNKWNVRVTLPKGEQKVGAMTIRQTDEEGGSFTSDFVVTGAVTFTNEEGETLGPISNSVSLGTNTGTWTRDGGDRAVSIAGSVSVDTDGDGSFDATLPGTSEGFHAGWTLEKGQLVAVPIQHTGPHPVLVPDLVNPIPGF